MKRDTIQTIFDMITLDECSFIGDVITLESEYKDYTLNVCFDYSEGELSYSLWFKETNIKLSENQENILVIRLKELENEYLQNEYELMNLRKQFYHDLSTLPYLKN